MDGRASRRYANGCCGAPSRSAQDGHIPASSKVRETQHHLSRFPQEYENLRAVFTWALKKHGEQEEHHVEIAARLGMALWRFWAVHWRSGEGCTLMDQVLAASEEDGPEVQATAIIAWGALIYHQGYNAQDYTRIEENLESCCSSVSRAEISQG